MKFLIRMMLCLMISFTLTELPVMKAQASMISTSEAFDFTKRDQAEKNVSEFLHRGDVKDQLVKLGLNPEEAQRRLASLSDKEVKELSADIEQSRAAGDLGGILVLVLLIVLIIFLVKRV